MLVIRVLELERYLVSRFIHFEIQVALSNSKLRCETLSTSPIAIAALRRTLSQ